MTIFDEIPALIVHHTELPIDGNIGEIHASDNDRVHTPETDNFRSTLRHVDLLLDHEILYLSFLDHIVKQEMN